MKTLLSTKNLRHSLLALILITAGLFASGNASAACTANYNWAFASGSTSEILTSNTSSSVNGFTSTWSWGDGTPNSTAKNSSHKFTTNGKFIVCLTIYDSTAHCSSSKCDTLNITGACTSRFFFKATQLSVAFNDSSSSALSDPHSASWTFGDGKTGTGDRPVHAYSKAGTYYACVTVYDSVTTCSTQYCNNVTVTACTLASSFTYSISFPTVSFTSTSSNTSKHTSYKWYFGDNTKDSTSGAKVNHSYTGTGNTFTVYLLLYDSATGCTAYSSQTITLCNISAKYTFIVSGALVYFKADSTNKPTVKYTWDFNDKTSSKLQNPQHTYSLSGTYNVCLLAKDSITGCSQSYCQNVTVNACKLTADFTYTMSGKVVTFTGTTNSTTPHKSIRWIFGDGNMDTTSGLSVKHTYPSSASSENVYLRIYDSVTKCLVYANHTIVFCTAPSAKFTYSISGRTVTLKSDSTNKSTVKYSWDYGDKSGTSTDKNPHHTYAADGGYSICLTATDSAGGCSATNCVSIKIAFCTLTASFKDSIAGHTVYFVGTTNASSHRNIRWIFGDGAMDSTSGLHATHTYASSVTTETVYFRVYDSVTKCLLYVSNSITLTTPCTLTASFGDSINGQKVIFTGKTNASAHRKITWIFGDNTTDSTSGLGVTHTYGSSVTTENVYLRVYDSVTKCLYYANKTITFGTPCTLTASFNDSINGHTVIFTGKSNASKHSSIKWFFGDNVTDSTSGLATKHTYSSSATTENVYLRIYDSTTKCLVYANKTLTFCSLSTSFTAKASLLSVTLTPISSHNTGSVSYTWTFGDGNSSTKQLPTYTYKLAGTYQVCVTAIDSATKCQASYCVTINVTNCTLAAAFSTTQSGRTVGFAGSASTKTHVRYVWIFGDGGRDSTSGANVKHTYTSSATSFNAYLIVYDSTTKCVAYYSKTISFCHASAHFTFAVSGLVMKAIPDSTNTSTAKYSWSFGDATYSKDKSPTHTFSKAGKYYVCLYVTDSPCTQSYCDSVTVTSSTSTTYCISGNARTSHVGAYPCEVYLITYNPKDSSLSAVDSTTTKDTSGSYQFCNLKNGTYYTKAALLKSASYYKYFIPTYHNDALKWSTAQSITVNGANVTGANIAMKAGTNAGGAGFIGGKIKAGANKTGDPQAGVLVILYDENQNAVTYTYSDATGYYSFPGIAFGTYTIEGEIPGKVSYPATATVSDTNATKNDVNLLVNITTITPDATSGIKPGKSWILENANIYPNPVTSKLMVATNLETSQPVHIQLTDITGKVISEMNRDIAGGSQTIEMDASQLNAGMYFIKIQLVKDNKILEGRFVKVQ